VKSNLIFHKNLSNWEFKIRLYKIVFIRNIVYKLRSLRLELRINLLTTQQTIFKHKTKNHRRIPTKLISILFKCNNHK
jgi:hypothetical protein